MKILCSELTDDEVEDLRSNFLTANLNSKSRYNPSCIYRARIIYVDDCLERTVGS